MSAQQYPPYQATLAACEKECDTLRQQLAVAQKRLTAVNPEKGDRVDELETALKNVRSERDAAQKACAGSTNALRLIQAMAHADRCERRADILLVCDRELLSTDQGSGYLSPEQVRPLIHALTLANDDTRCTCAATHVPDPECPHCTVMDALAHAKAIGAIR